MPRHHTHIDWDDDYVREFVQGISKLKLIKAHSIMAPIDEFRATDDRSLDDSLRADEGADLDQLIDLSVETYAPIIITENGQDVGVVDKARLLRGIQGVDTPPRIALFPYLSAYAQTGLDETGDRQWGDH